MIDGIELGRREELCGGGLRRVRKAGVDEEPLMYDERVLGSGEFVQQLVGEPKELPPIEKSLPLDIVVGRVARVLGISVEEIRSPGRSKAVVEARCLISYLGYKRMGQNGEAVAKVLGITRSGVCRRSRAGEGLFQANKRWQELFS
jgi:hypothetical protein